MSLLQLEEQILSLPTGERALLAERLLESLDADESDESVLGHWLDVAALRMDEIRNGKVATIPSGKIFNSQRRAS